jgi:hypothetical protein
MAQFLDTRGLGDFLNSQGSLFRVHFDGEFPPNIGDTWGIQMTGGMGATMLVDYTGYLGHEKMAKLLNVRYTLRRTDLPGRSPVFSDGEWKVYENAGAGARAWVVHQLEIDPSTERPLKRLEDPDFDPEKTAVLERPTQQMIDAPAESAGEQVENVFYGPTSMEFRVTSRGRGLLVLSEVYYPGWEATMNGRSVSVHRVNGALRGVEVPDGTSAVRLEYRPLSVRIGFAFSLTAAVATLALGIGSYRPRRKLTSEVETVTRGD